MARRASHESSTLSRVVSDSRRCIRRLTKRCGWPSTVKWLCQRQRRIHISRCGARVTRRSKYTIPSSHPTFDFSATRNGQPYADGLVCRKTCWGDSNLLFSLAKTGWRWPKRGNQGGCLAVLEASCMELWIKRRCQVSGRLHRHTTVLTIQISGKKL